MRRSWHRCSPVDLQRLARAWFVDARRIELAKLALELGISRATAYRWAGSTEQLIGDVLAGIVTETFERIRDASDERGTTLLLEVLEGTMRQAHAFEPLRRYLDAQPQTGLRLVASKHGPVQAQTIKLVKDLIEAEIEAGEMQLTVPTDVMAYALTRIVESFLYADLITGAKPDLNSAAKILEIMLTAPEAGAAA